ncbi:UvrD-helicase domain-containing protein [Streptomyces sp. SID8359]|uniref:ATP-dependent helicase n=1 Tax=unclassified Streptomyces TaxID=2593676 RepID=UPI00048F45C9|nr:MULTISPECIES: ATP-dependent helicase [unclassified Streptomyces]MYT91908.1 UvrD-helicase domain-containing protein [Streptomyces sp. SID8359]MYT93092.1 UvrD-helicase domain-containing protein [Streptomyces sp. SID8359]
MQVSDALLAELDSLHPRQLAAVLHDGNVVLRAGPGSGKTRTLVARIAYVLQTQISSFRGVACITYTNPAAEEIRRRVHRSGVRTEGRITCSTAHAFCLNEILRAFGHLTGQPAPEAGQVLSKAAIEALLQRCFDQVGIGEVLAQYRVPQSTKIRRALACNEDLDSFDPREVQAALLYEEQLLLRGVIDFEAMVIRAVHLVREHAHVRDLLRARFPHLVVDEYQDLGGVLHELVLALRDLAGIIVFAVGDTDQSVYGFTGADAKYLTELADRPDFRDLELEVNYRSGQDIITVAEAALGLPHGRLAREGAPPGDVKIEQVEGGLQDHARVTCDLVEQAQSKGISPERIAILYPARGRLLDDVRRELTRRELDFRHEGDDKLPAGSLSRFVQRCAARAVTNYQIHAASNADRADMLRRAQAPSLASLARTLTTLRTEARLAPPPSRLFLPRALQECLDPEELYPADAPALAWLEQLRACLALDEVAAGHPDQDNTSSLDGLAGLCWSKGLVLQYLARGEEVVGKVLLATYHAAKGREFDTVVLPGLLQGLIPHDVPAGGNRWRKPTEAELEEQRRTFYVALTRAESTVNMIVGSGYETKNGYWMSFGPSNFVIEMVRRLPEEET